MARLPNFLVIIRSEKLSGKGQGRGAKKRTFRFGKKNVSFPKVETFRFADYTTREGAFVILEVNHRSEEARLEMFERLTWYKDTLEMDFPEGLTWDICFVRDTGKQVARIYTAKSGIDFHRRQDWGEFFSFMASQMYLLERNFMSIAEYLRE